jgi:hypothetical protein
MRRSPPTPDDEVTALRERLRVAEQRADAAEQASRLAWKTVVMGKPPVTTAPLARAMTAADEKVDEVIETSNQRTRR